MRDIKPLVARKAVHVVFVALVALPLLLPVPMEAALSLLLVAAGFVYSVQVKEPARWAEFRQGIFRSLEEFADALEAIPPLDRPELRERYLKAVRELEAVVDAAERDYEKRGGYLGALMGILGFTAAYLLFGAAHLPPALVSMAVYDAVSAVAGSLAGGPRWRGRVSPAGTLAGAAANVAALAALGYGLPAAAAITALVVAADLVSVEDNLLIPLAAAGGSYLLLGGSYLLLR